MAFAGLWERWKDPRQDVPLETFSIITTDPNQVVAPLHNRMPVIIERNDYARWLGGSTAQPPLDLLRPFPAEQMIAWKVDKAVGNVRNDAAQLLVPLAPEEQAARKIVLTTGDRLTKRGQTAAQDLASGGQHRQSRQSGPQGDWI